MNRKAFLFFTYIIKIKYNLIKKNLLHKLCCRCICYVIYEKKTYLRNKEQSENYPLVL